VIRAIMVDSGDVLIRTMPWEDRLRRALALAPQAPDEAQVARAAAAARAWARGVEPVDLLPTWADEDRYALALAEVVAHALGPSGPDPRYLRETCHYVNACRPYPDALEALGALRGLGFRVGVISDAPPSMRAALARLGFLALVDHVTLSSDVGHMKPDPAIFRAALDAVGVAPEEAIFVDDTPGNIDGAHAFGFAQAYVIDRDGHAQGRADRLPDLSALMALMAPHAPALEAARRSAPSLASSPE
jgi:HAD superfamily hydrolase (TIGR01509 family)